MDKKLWATAPVRLMWTGLVVTVILASGCQLPGPNLTPGQATWRKPGNALFGRSVPSHGSQQSRAAQSYQPRPLDQRVQPAAWQESELIQPRELTGSNPESIPRQWPEQTAAPQPGERLMSSPATRRPEAGRFHADAVYQSMPQTATERLIELSSEMAIMREEMTSLTQSVQELQNENGRLLHIRDELHARLAQLEQRLERSLQSEAAARAQFDTLSQRVQIFNERRQRQIDELNQIIDQLEVQLRQSDPFTQPSNQNPYRDSSGGRNDMR